MVADELLAIQNRMSHDDIHEETAVHDPNSEKGEDKDEGMLDQDQDTDTAYEDGDVEVNEANEDADTKGTESDDNSVEELEGFEGGDKGDAEGGESHIQVCNTVVRRSQRVITPSWLVQSPWIDKARKAKGDGKRSKDEKDLLFQLCTTKTTGEEAAQEYVSMGGYFVRRWELYCLRPRGWINTTLMTMVAKTLVEDQKEKHGRVIRHIFSSEFMCKMIENPEKWTWESYKAQVIPEELGYNIRDCDFIFGPTVFMSHWFCYVLDTKTMKFYDLDSMVDTFTYFRKQK